MYCASLFLDAIRPALRLCMRALRARLPNVPNEINDFNGFTVPPETHDFNEINEITIPRPPNGITKATKPTKKTKRPEKRRFVVFVVYGSIVISLGTLPRHPSQSRFARQLPRRGSQVYRRQTRQTSGKAKPQRSAPYHRLAGTHGRALASPCGGGGQIIIVSATGKIK